jgi:L-ascorbate metabolism protein UlaG (beta-lactamase superfamily)
MKFWIILLLMSLMSFALSAKDYPISDHYDGKKFFNPTENQLHTVWELIKWRVTAKDNQWPDQIANKVYPVPVLSSANRAIATFVGHSTFLLQLKELNVLTDPMFSERASPVKFIGPKRIRAPGLKLEELPKIDVVIISHNHYDHLDLESLKVLDGKYHPLFLVPLGNEKILKEAGIQNVHEMDWWEEHIIREHKFTFTPAQHWSGRGLFDKCETLWGSFFIQSPTFKTYFAGDTGLATHFANIRLRLGAPDLSLLPIGGYEPQYFMKINHMTPEEAFIAHQDLNSTFSIGMHFGTFPFTDEPVQDPVERLKKKKSEVFNVLDHGESRVF